MSMTESGERPERNARFSRYRSQARWGDRAGTALPARRVPADLDIAGTQHPGVETAARADPPPLLMGSSPFGHGAMDIGFSQ